MECPLWTEWSENLSEGTVALQWTPVAPRDVGNALADAFPVPPPGPFKHPLDAMDGSTSRAT